MPKYGPNTLHRLQHELSKRPQHAPHPYSKPINDQKVQFTNPQDDTQVTLLNTSTTNFIHRIVGFFLYYGIALDFTLLFAPGDISSLQTKTTAALMKNITWFLNYAATQPDTKICFQKVTWFYIFQVMVPTDQ